MEKRSPGGKPSPLCLQSPKPSINYKLNKLLPLYEELAVVPTLTEITSFAGGDGHDLDLSRLLLNSAIVLYPRQVSGHQLIHQGPSQLIGSSITHYLCHCKYLRKNVTLRGGIYPSTLRRQPVQSLDGWERIYIYIYTHLFWFPMRKCYQIFLNPLNKEEQAVTVEFTIHRTLGG